MGSRYDDRDYERGRSSSDPEQRYGRGRQSYDRGRSQEYGRYSEDRSGTRPRFDRDEGERYSTEDRWRGDYGGSRNLSRPWRENEYGRDSSASRLDWEGEGDFSNERSQSRYGSTGRGYDTGEYSQGRYGQGQQYGRGGRQYGDSPRYNYPGGLSSRETYGGHGAYEDYGSRFLRDEGNEYDYGRESGGRQDRGWWDRASDEVASWFGDEDATRRRRMDQQREEYRGRGPKNYRRSDDRIKEDVNDRLSQGYLDASDIEVTVSNTEVTLTGNVNSRADKRRAEAVAESVTGVTNVENRLRVRQNDYGTSRYSGTELSGTTDTSTTTNTGTSNTSAKRATSGS